MLNDHKVNRLFFKILDFDLVDLVGVVEDDSVACVSPDIGAIVLRFSLGHLHVAALADIKFHFPIHGRQSRPIFSCESDPFAAIIRLLFSLNENPDLAREQCVGTKLRRFVVPDHVRERDADRLFFVLGVPRKSCSIPGEYLFDSQCLYAFRKHFEGLAMFDGLGESRSIANPNFRGA